MGGRGRTCPARLWMVYGWLWEGRGPGMPGPYKAAIFAAGGALNARRRGQDPSLQYLWKSRCLLGYWAVGAGHARPGYGWCMGGYGKAAGRACPAPTGRQFLQRAAVGDTDGHGKARQSPSGRLRLPLTFIIPPGLRSPPAARFPPAAERSHPDTPDCPRWSGSARRFLPAQHRGRRAGRRSHCRRPGRPGRPAIQSVPRPGWRWPGQWQPARR